eukprot:9494218-Karenia_brevis.AAC.1
MPGCWCVTADLMFLFWKELRSQESRTEEMTMQSTAVFSSASGLYWKEMKMCHSSDIWGLLSLHCGHFTQILLHETGDDCEVAKHLHTQ